MANHPEAKNIYHGSHEGLQNRPGEKKDEVRIVRNQCKMSFFSKGYFKSKSCRQKHGRVRPVETLQNWNINN